MRVFLHGGDDVVDVRGGRGPIEVRAIGGGGDDRILAAEVMLVNMKLALAANVRKMRQDLGMTQLELAKRIKSSQSRIAKMEVADGSVSMELFVRSLAALGATCTQIGKIVGTRTVKEKRAAGQKKRPAATRRSQSTPRSKRS